MAPMPSADLDRDFPGLPRSVRGCAREWVAAGLLDEAKARELLAHSSKAGRESARNLLGIVFSAIAGLFVLAGIILLVAEHWEKIHHLVILAEVAVPPSGNLQIIRLLVDGKPY